MNITDVRVRRTFTDEKMKALVSITVDGDLAVHDIKVIEGAERLFVAMPSRKDENGVFRDISHPITPEARKTLEDAVLNAYHEAVGCNGAEEGQCSEVTAPLNEAGERSKLGTMIDDAFNQK